MTDNYSDARVSDVLAAIEAKGQWLQRDAANLANFVRLLAYRRDFYTKAEDALDLAERELLNALASVRAIRKEFQAKPTEQTHAA
jgi:hypothetical protein